MASALLRPDRQAAIDRALAAVKVYRSIGFRAVKAQSMGEAAHVFAQRLARREYGRRGVVRTLNLNSWARDGSCGDYQAFLGLPGPEPGQTTGGDVWIHVYTETEGKRSA